MQSTSGRWRRDGRTIPLTKAPVWIQYKAVTGVPMDPIEIPVASAIGRLVVIACCVLIVWAVLWWWWPKFTIFLNTVSGRTLRKPETKNIHMILGFIVYAIILAPAAIATFIGVGIATTAPTLISSTGVMGTTFACEGLPSVVIFTCSTWCVWSRSINSQVLVDETASRQSERHRRIRLVIRSNHPWQVLCFSSR